MLVAGLVWIATEAAAAADWHDAIPSRPGADYAGSLDRMDGHLSGLFAAALRYPRPNSPSQSNDEESRAVYPLHWAALQDQARVVASLLDQGANPDARDPEGRTPLIVAAAFGSHAAAEVLLERGADPRLRDFVGGNSALDYAAMAGQANVARLLLALGADVNGRAPSQGETALHYAAFYGQRKLIRLLVASGADVDAADNSGVRSLQYAGRRRQGLAVQLLRQLGARPDDLHDAVNAGDVARVQALIAAGENVNGRSLFGTPLHLAVATGQAWIAGMLIDAGARLEAEGDPGRARPLHVAALTNQPAAAALLIAKGADVDVRDDQGRTPLTVAAAYGSLEVAEVLLLRGADPFAQEEVYRDTPMHYAAASGRVEMVDLLLAFGVDINIRSGHDGEPPLTYAAHRGRAQMVEFLVANGADPTIEDHNGTTPLESVRAVGTGGANVELLRSLRKDQ
jgi:ankyrin repeat protein